VPGEQGGGGAAGRASTDNGHIIYGFHGKRDMLANLAEMQSTQELIGGLQKRRGRGIEQKVAKGRGEFRTEAMPKPCQRTGPSFGGDRSVLWRRNKGNKAA
jgi:hypothetical protein